MAQDLTRTKQNFASASGVLAERLLNIARDCDEFSQFYFTNGLSIGAANAFTQADLDGTANQHLTPDFIALVVTAAQLLAAAMDATVRNNLRLAMTKPLE